MNTSHAFYISLSYGVAATIIAIMVINGAYSYFKTRNKLSKIERH